MISGVKSKLSDQAYVRALEKDLASKEKRIKVLESQIKYLLQRVK